MLAPARRLRHLRPCEPRRRLPRLAARACRALRQLGKRVTCVLPLGRAARGRTCFVLPGPPGSCRPARSTGPVGVLHRRGRSHARAHRDGGARHPDARGLQVTIDHHAVDERCATSATWIPMPPLPPCSSGSLRTARASRDRGDRHVLLHGPGHRHRSLPVSEHRRAAACAPLSRWSRRVPIRHPFRARCSRTARSPPSQLEAHGDHRALVPSSGEALPSWLSLDDFAEFGAVKADAEPVINALRSIAASALPACCASRRTMRGSLRAKDDTDVAAIARRVRRRRAQVAAAGFTMHGSMRGGRGSVARPSAREAGGAPGEARTTDLLPGSRRGQAERHDAPTTWSTAAVASSARSASATRARSIRWPGRAAHLRGARHPARRVSDRPRQSLSGHASRSALGLIPTTARVRSSARGEVPVKSVTVLRRAVRRADGREAQAAAAGVFRHQGEREEGLRSCARRGRIIELAPRDIEVYSAKLIAVRPGVGEQLPEWDVEFRVSKGTYIRALARDLRHKPRVPRSSWLRCGARRPARSRSTSACRSRRLRS